MPEKIVIKTKDQRRIDELEKENQFLNLKIETLNEQSDFHEELIVELATMLYEP